MFHAAPPVFVSSGVALSGVQTWRNECGRSASVIQNIDILAPPVCSVYLPTSLAFNPMFLSSRLILAPEKKKITKP